MDRLRVALCSLLLVAASTDEEALLPAIIPAERLASEAMPAARALLPAETHAQREHAALAGFDRAAVIKNKKPLGGLVITKVAEHSQARVFGMVEGDVIVGWDVPVTPTPWSFTELRPDRDIRLTWWSCTTGQTTSVLRPGKLGCNLGAVWFPELFAIKLGRHDPRWDDHLLAAALLLDQDVDAAESALAAAVAAKYDGWLVAPLLARIAFRQGRYDESLAAARAAGAGKAAVPASALGVVAEPTRFDAFIAALMTRRFHLASDLARLVYAGKTMTEATTQLDAASADAIAPIADTLAAGAKLPLVPSDRLVGVSPGGRELLAAIVRDGKFQAGPQPGKTFIASIGPPNRDFAMSATVRYRPSPGPTPDSDPSTALGIATLQALTSQPQISVRMTVLPRLVIVRQPSLPVIEAPPAIETGYDHDLRVRFALVGPAWAFAIGDQVIASGPRPHLDAGDHLVPFIQLWDVTATISDLEVRLSEVPAARAPAAGATGTGEDGPGGK